MSVSLSDSILDETHVQVFVCLPCYNEAENIPQLLQQIHLTLQSLLPLQACEQELPKVKDYQILAVDDGSTDCTRELLEENARTYPLTVISHERNKGLAETYRTLLNTLEARANDNDIAVFLDADNTHPPQVIVDLIRAVSASADVAVASRYNGGVEVGVPLRRRILSKVVNWLIRSLCKVSIQDCTCGYRAYRLRVLKQLPPLESKGFEISAEVIIRISSHTPSYTIEEVPLTLRYDQKNGPSKIRLGRTIKAYMKLLWKHSRLDLTPLVRRVAYKVNPYLGRAYDKDHAFWNDGMMALAFLIVSFFIYDGLTHTLPQTLRLLGYISIAFVSFCIQHFLRRFWVFQE